MDQIAFPYAPRHGSWVNRAAPEIRIRNGQCLGRRLESRAAIARAVAAWEDKRNAQQARIHWTFARAAARRKRRQRYPSIDD